MDPEHRFYAERYIAWCEALERGDPLPNIPTVLEDKQRFLQLHHEGLISTRLALEKALHAASEDTAMTNQDTREMLQHDYQEKLKLEARAIVKISEMDENALVSDEVCGHVSRTGLGNFIGDIHIPTPQGYQVVTPVKAHKKNHHTIPTVGSYTKKGHLTEDIVAVVLPFSIPTNRAIPLPAGYALIAIEDIDQDEESAHFVLAGSSATAQIGTFNVDTAYPKGIKALIRKIPTTPLEHQNFAPSLAEQTFWQSKLPLPQEIAHLHKEGNQGKFFTALEAYFRDNFYYVCQYNLGQIILKHKHMLPLIAQELKMGHCDLLSWTLAGYLRGCGIAAFTTDEKVVKDNPTGDAVFKSAAGHARVGIIDPSGKVTYLDPTQWCPKIKVEQEDLDVLSADLTQSVDRKQQELAIQKLRAKTIIAGERQAAVDAGAKLALIHEDLSHRDANFFFGHHAGAQLESANQNPTIVGNEVRQALGGVINYCSKNHLRYYEANDLSIDADILADVALRTGHIDQNDVRLRRLNNCEYIEDILHDPTVRLSYRYDNHRFTFPIQDHGRYRLLKEPRLRFTSNFKNFLQTKLIPELNPGRSDCSLPLPRGISDWEADAYDIQVFVWLQMVLQSDQAANIKQRLQQELGMTEEQIFFVKKTIQPVSMQPAVTVEINQWLKQKASPSQGAAIALTVPQKEWSLAYNAMIQVLEKAVVGQTKGRPEPVDWTLTEYSPDIHTIRDIHWPTTARTGRAIAQSVEMRPQQKQSLYIVCDAQDYWQTLLLLQGMKHLQVTRNVDCFLYTPQTQLANTPCYVHFSADRIMSDEQLRMLAKRINVDKSAFSYLPNPELRIVPATQKPAHVLCISDEDGNLNCIQAQIKSRCKLTCTTWKGSRTAVYPKVKESWLAL